MKRLVAALVALVAAWLGGAPTAAAAIPSAADAVYTYDGGHHANASTYTTQERGPPGTYDHPTAYDAGARWSHCVSARPDGATTPFAYTYNDPTELAQIAGLASATQRPAEGTPGKCFPLEGGLVGAGFIAAQLGDVDADGVGEGLLGHAALFADRGEAVGEVHGGRYENGRISHRRHHHPPLRPRRTPDEAALGDDRIAPVAELNDEDLNLVASFIDTLVTKTRLKVLASGS